MELGAWAHFPGTLKLRHLLRQRGSQRAHEALQESQGRPPSPAPGWRRYAPQLQAGQASGPLCPSRLAHLSSWGFLGATGHAPKLGGFRSPGANWGPPLLAGGVGRGEAPLLPALRLSPLRRAWARNLTCGASAPSSATSCSRSRSGSGGHRPDPRAAFSIAKCVRGAGRVPRCLQGTARAVQP